MCFGNHNGGSGGSGGGSGSGGTTTAQSVYDQLLANEKKRQEDVKAGQAAIDSNFSQFDDNFFNRYQDAFKGFYNPQIDEQYTDADGTLQAGLARNGIDRSTTAATKIGQLYRTYLDQRADIGNKAADAANDMRTQVSNAKSNLYALNSSSADPAQANNQALASATALVKQPTYSPVGQVFASFLEPWTAYANSYSRGVDRNAATYNSPYGG